MNLPTYIQDADQNNFIEELIQTLRDNLSDDGWVVPSITMADLTFITTAPNSMPDGTIWYVSNHIPPCFVGQISGTLVQFVTAAYP